MSWITNSDYTTIVDSVRIWFSVRSYFKKGKIRGKI